MLQFGFEQLQLKQNDDYGKKGKVVSIWFHSDSWATIKITAAIIKHIQGQLNEIGYDEDMKSISRWSSQISI